MAIEADIGFASAPGSRRKIVVIGNEKGGTGKSTTALHLAIAALYRGYRVGTIDMDSRQATLSRYLDHRSEYAETIKAVPLPQNLRIDEPGVDDTEAQEIGARRSIDAALAELADCDVVLPIRRVVRLSCRA
jgi:chromosome partitioning protein